MDDQSEQSNTPRDEEANPVFTDDDGGFDHPDAEEIEQRRVPNVDSADDAVDGDDDRKARLKQKARELNQKAESLEDGETDVNADTPVSVDEEVDPYDNLDQAADGGTEASDGNATTLDSGERSKDSIDQASESLFDDDEAAAVEEEYGDDFELNRVEDIPDDFDFEAQDTEKFGAGDDEAVIQHEGVYFKLEKPTGAKEDKFWMEMQEGQQNGRVTAVFDTMIRYTVTRPRNIRGRMQEENWNGFAKAGLATKCSVFLGLDELQDF